jgi:hypothetical protein
VAAYPSRWSGSPVGGAESRLAGRARSARVEPERRPDPGADPVGYTQAQVLQLRQLTNIGWREGTSVQISTYRYQLCRKRQCVWTHELRLLKTLARHSGRCGQGPPWRGSVRDAYHEFLGVAEFGLLFTCEDAGTSAPGDEGGGQPSACR